MLHTSKNIWVGLDKEKKIIQPCVEKEGGGRKNEYDKKSIQDYQRTNLYVQIKQ